MPSFLELKAPGSYYLLGLSVLFVVTGILTSYLRYRGRLKRIGITTEDIRQETISKLKDEQLLAKIALKDKNEETRQAAAERLQEIKD